MAKGKGQLPILKNKAYCKILIALNDKKLIAQEIANKLSIDQSGVIKNLKHLIKKKYVNVEKVKKTKYYYVNWDKIRKEYNKFLLGKKQNFSLIKDYFSFYNYIYQDKPILLNIFQKLIEIRNKNARQKPLP